MLQKPARTPSCSFHTPPMYLLALAQPTKEAEAATRLTLTLPGRV
jgi:hypothetical protein